MLKPIRCQSCRRIPITGRLESHRGAWLCANCLDDAIEAEPLIGDRIGRRHVEAEGDGVVAVIALAIVALGILAAIASVRFFK